jgi:hypothetical protein
MKISQKLAVLLNESRFDRYLAMLPSRRFFDTDENFTSFNKDAKYFLKRMTDLGFREDMIIWAMRHVILGVYLSNHIPEFTGIKELSPFIVKLASKANVDLEYYRVRGNLIQVLQHYNDLPIHSIQSFRFNNQDVDQVLSFFKEEEDKWKSQNQGLIPDVLYKRLPENEKPELLIDYGDGYYLFDLKKNGCRLEADAMGHCSTGAHPGDTNWSIRERVDVDSSHGWRPVVTIIWNQNGWVNEIKSAGNEKPDYKFFPHIVKALMLDRVEGHYWPHRGWKQENDFTIMDLPEEEAKEITRVKPKLCPAPFLAKILGFTEESVEIINNSLETELEALPKDHKLYGKAAILEKYDEGVDFVNRRIPSKNEIHEYIGYVTGDKNIEYWGGKNNESEIQDLLEAALKRSPEFLDHCIKAIELEVAEEVLEEYEGLDADDAVSLIMDEDNEGEYLSEIRQALDDAVNRGYETGTESQIYEYVENALNDYLTPVNEGENVLYNPCFITVTADQLAEYYEDMDDLFEEILEDFSFSAPYYGFQEYDGESALGDFIEYKVPEFDKIEPGIDENQMDLDIVT